VCASIVKKKNKRQKLHFSMLRESRVVLLGSPLLYEASWIRRISRTIVNFSPGTIRPKQKNSQTDIKETGKHFSNGFAEIMIVTRLKSAIKVISTRRIQFLRNYLTFAVIVMAFHIGLIMALFHLTNVHVAQWDKTRAPWGPPTPRAPINYVGNS